MKHLGEWKTRSLIVVGALCGAAYLGEKIAHNHGLAGPGTKEWAHTLGAGAVLGAALFYSFRLFALFRMSK